MGEGQPDLANQIRHHAEKNSAYALSREITTHLDDPSYPYDGAREVLNNKTKPGEKYDSPVTAQEAGEAAQVLNARYSEQQARVDNFDLQILQAKEASRRAAQSRGSGMASVESLEEASQDLDQKVQVARKAIEAYGIPAEAAAWHLNQSKDHYNNNQAAYVKAAAEDAKAEGVEVNLAPEYRDEQADAS